MPSNPAATTAAHRSGRFDLGGRDGRIEDRVTGWWVFAGILLLVAGVLNIIWGIGAISDAKFFVAGQKYIVGSLHGWGWITLILGVIELIAGLSLFSGGGFGRWLGIFAAALGLDQRAAVDPRLPVLVACVFALSIIILYELAKAPERRTTT